MSRPVLNIIGAGRAAQVLARLWVDAEVFNVGSVLNRTPESASSAVAFIGAGHPVATVEAMGPADAWLLGCPDDAIGPVARTLGELGATRDTDILFHLSGALPAATISGPHGSKASFHPARTFADPGAALHEFEGTPIAIEGDEPARAAADGWARAIGADPFVISGAVKRLYHAASAIAANYLVTLVNASMEVYGQAGIDEQVARRLSCSLARGALDNTESLGPESALTGPIVRGDVATVASHLQVLPADQRPMYRVVGQMTVDLARRAGRLDEATARQILAALAAD